MHWTLPDAAVEIARGPSCGTPFEHTRNLDVNDEDNVDNEDEDDNDTRCSSRDPGEETLR